MAHNTVRKAIFYNSMLGTGMPGVELVVVRGEGAERTVYCKRSSQDDARYQPLPAPVPGEQKKEKVFLRFGRDEAHAKGGIAAPNIGLSVIRGGDTARPWTFNGEISDSSDHAHTLTFTRPLTQQASAR